MRLSPKTSVLLAAFAAIAFTAPAISDDFFFRAKPILINSPDTAPIKLAVGAPPQALVGTPYSHAMTISGGTRTYTSISLTNTAGSLASLGLQAHLEAMAIVISGTPTSPGTWTGTFSITDTKGQVSVASAPVSITAITPPLIVSLNTTPPTGYTQSPYAYGSVLAQGGKPPYKYFVSSDATNSTRWASNNLIINESNGTISSTKLGTTAGSFTGQVGIIDSLGATASAALSIPILNNPLKITTDCARYGIAQLSFSCTFTGTGGTPPYVYSVVDNSVPNFSLNATSGAASMNIPTTLAGSYSFVAQVTDKNGIVVQSIPQTVGAIRNPGPPIVTGYFPDVYVTVGQSVNLVTGNKYGGASGSAKTWSLTGAFNGTFTSNNLTGVISFTATSVGTATAKVMVVDWDNQPGYGMPFKIYTFAKPSLMVSPHVAFKGEAYSFTPAISGGRTPFSQFSYSPIIPGLSINPSTGSITGTPTTAGNYSIFISGKDANGYSFTFSSIPLNVVAQ